VGAAQPPGHGHAFPAGDLVLAEHLQEVQVAQFAGLGLDEAGVEGFQHSGQLQRPQAGVQGGIENGVADGHRVISW